MLDIVAKVYNSRYDDAPKQGWPDAKLCMHHTKNRFYPLPPLPEDHVDNREEGFGTVWVKISEVSFILYEFTNLRVA